MRKNPIRRSIALLLTLCMAFSILPAASAAAGLVPADGWSIVNEDGNLVINGTDSITITTQLGDFSLDENAGLADNYWLRTPADKDFALTLKVSGGMNANWQKAGIMVFKDDDTIASVVRRYHSGLNGAGNVLGMFQYLGDFQEPVIVDPDPDAPVWLKLVKAGSEFEGFYRFSEAAEWVSLGTLTNATVANAADMKIGVFAVNGSANKSVDVTLEEFTYNGEPIPFAVESETVPARQVNLSAAALSLETGSSTELTAQVIPAYATDSTVTWVSSDESVAAVSGGKVTAVGEGTAVITAACGSVSASCAVTVSAPIVGSRLYLSDLEWVSAKVAWPNNGSPNKDKDVDGGTIELDGVTYEKGIAAHAASEIVYNIENMGVTWFLADIGLDNDRSGDANFVIKVDGEEVYRKDNVKGSDPTINVRQPIPEGAKKLTLITEAPGSNTNDHTVWANAQIVVAYEDGVPVSSIQVTTESGRTSFSVSEGTVAMTATVLPATAADPSVSWSVAPGDGASIDETGSLTVTKPGTYTVTAAANDGSGVSGSIELVFVETSNTWITDEVTKSGWIGTYGSDGYVLCGWNDKNDVTSLPYYIDEIRYSFQDRSGGFVAQKAASSANSGWEYGLPHPDAPEGERRIAYQFDDKAMTVHITANDDYEHRLTFYCVSENDKSRQQTVQLLDPATGDPISDGVVMTNLDEGKYITITFSGSVDVLFHNDNYNPLNTNVVVNGIFFDTDYAGDTIPVRSLSITPADGEVLRPGTGQVRMAATVQPANATDPTLRWSVDNADVASVDETGLVTITRAGTVTVTAASLSNPEVTDSVTLIVTEGGEIPEQAEITLLGGSYAMIQNKLVRLLFDLETGYYSVYEQETGLPYVLNAYFQVNGEKSSKGYAFAASELLTENGKTLRLTGTKEGANDLILDIGLEDDTGDILLRAGITNKSGSGVKVMQMVPMAAKYAEKGGIFVGPDPEQNHALLTGEGNWTVPQVKQGVTATSKNNLLLSYRNNPELATFLIGQLTTYSFQSTITTAYNPGSALVNNGRGSIDADIRIYDSTGKLVDDGATYVGDVALLNFTTKNPYDALDEYAWRQAEAMEVDLMDFDPYIYECLWYVNWYTSGANNADFAVQEVKDLYEKGLANYAIPNLRVEPDTYVNPNEQLWWDDEHWLSFGHLTDTYPTMKDWLDAMHALNAEGGTYMQASYRSNDYCEEYPEQMIGNVAEGGPDYTDPDFIAHMAEVYTRLKEDGMRSIFYDYAGQYHGPGASYLLNLTGGFEDEYATAVEAYRNIFALPKTYIGSDVRITENSWEYSGSDVAIGLIDIQRNIGDTNEFNPDIATVAINQWYRHRKTKLLYSDVKVFESDNEDLRRAQITGTGFFFGKTTLGETVNRMSQEKIQDIGKIVPFPVDGIAARPVGLFEGDYTINPEVLDYKFDSRYDDHILLLWNQDGAGTKAISADLGLDTAFGGVGLDVDKEYEVWDFWNWQYIGTYKGSDVLTQSVRNNEMRTLAVREIREEPYLLSTNRHVLQGTQEIDVKAFSYDAAANTVTGTFDIVGGDTYKAIISLAGKELMIDSFTFDNAAVTGDAKQNTASGYIEITLDSAENQTVPFTLVLREGSVADDTTAPSQITGLSAAADEYGYVTLNWDHSTDDSAYIQLTYEIYGGTDPDFTPDLSNILAAATENAFTDANINQGEYYYKVRAVDGAGNASEFAAVKTDTQVMAVVPGSLTMTAGSEHSGEEANRAVDGDTGSLWHTDWNGTDRANMWIDMEFPQPTAVNTYEYLPRNNSSQNGMIQKYELHASTDGGETYQVIATGEWDLQAGWKTVTFEEMTVTNLRLYAITSVGSYASAAEVRAYRALEIDSIEVREPLLELKPGEQAGLLVDLYPTNLQGAELTYTSDNEAAATVDSGGTVTAIAPGTAVITVSTANGKTAQCTVHVSGEHICPGARFTDVNVEAWYHEAVDYVLNSGMMQGNGDGTFTPDSNLSRAMLVQILYNINGRPAVEPTVEFPDVAEGVWFYDAVMWAANTGVVLGHDDGTFAPDDDVTRDQMVTILWRYAGKPEASNRELPFEDADEIGAYALDAVAWAVEQGIVQGMDDNRFAPKGSATRAQIAQIMMNYFSK